MKSHFQLFPSTWGNRQDFPIELDVKYALLEIQSHVYANDQIHPIFYTLCDTINKHEKAIVKECKRYFEEQPDHHLREIVNIYVFEKMIPNIINYIRFCQRYADAQSITHVEGIDSAISPREIIYYLWMDELPNNLWLPFYSDHPVHKKYYQVFDAKISV